MSSVVSIILNHERNQVALVKRRDVPVWVLPGGGIDPHETPEAAAVREAHEETGLITAISRKVAEYTPLNRLARFTHLYECRQIGGDLMTGAETREVAFFPVDALPPTLFFLHKIWLEDALRNQPEIIRQPITQVTYSAFLRYLARHPYDTLRFALSRLGLPINSGK